MSDVILLDAAAMSDLFGNAVVVWAGALAGLWFALSLLLVMLNPGAAAIDHAPAEPCTS